MLCVVGDLLEDVVVHVAAATVADDDNAARIERRRGGSAGNVVAAAALAGAGSPAVRFVGRVGDDATGRALAVELAAAGVDVRVQRGGRTGTVVVVVAPGGGRTMYPDRAAAAELGPVDPAWLDAVTWLHVPAYSLCAEPIATSTLAFLDAAGARRRPPNWVSSVPRADPGVDSRENRNARHPVRGVGLSVDVSSAALVEAFGAERFVELLVRLAPDVVFATAAEAAVLGSWLPALLVVKDGPRPVDLRWVDGRRENVPVPPVAGVVDTTGAGDAFAAGYLVAALAGADPRDAAAAGSALAARTLVRAGASL